MLDKILLKGEVSYHDPFQLARNGGIYEKLRCVASHLTNQFEELNPTKKENRCCVGGGDLVAIGDKEYRTKTAKIKADQIRNTQPDTLVTACENCYSQLGDLNDFYKLEIDVQFLSGVVAAALKYI